MKISILVSTIILFFILNACQGRNMPIQASQVDNNISTSIPQLTKQETKLSTKKIHKLQKHIEKEILPKRKREIKVSKVHKSPSKKRTFVKQAKVVKTLSTPVDNLPPLPTIPSIAESHTIPLKPIIKQEKAKTHLHTTPILDSKKETETIANTIINTKVSQPRESFSGGDIADNLDMATIRIGKSSDYTSIIFDSYHYEGKGIFPSKKSSTSGTYLFTYEPSKKRIVGIMDGYKAFSALLNEQRALFSGNNVVKNIYILKRLGNDGIKFVIKLRKNVRANIFDVKNPGRIIVNLFPL